MRDKRNRTINTLAPKTLNYLMKLLSQSDEPDDGRYHPHDTEYLYRADRTPLMSLSPGTYRIISPGIVALENPIDPLELLRLKWVPVTHNAIKMLIHVITENLLNNESAALSKPGSEELCLITRSAKAPGHWQYTYFSPDGGNSDTLCAEPDGALLATIKAGFHRLYPPDKVTASILSLSRESC